MRIMFTYNGLVFTITVGDILGCLAVQLLVRSYPHVNGAARWAVHFGIFACALVLWSLINVRVWIIVPSIDEPDILS